MNKLIGMCLLLFVCFWPIQAPVQAEEQEVIRGEWTNPLSENDPAASDQKRYVQAAISDEQTIKLQENIEAALLQRNTSFTVQYTGEIAGMSENVQQAFQSVLSDYEYINYDFQGYSFSARGTDGNINVVFNVSYFQTAEQAAYVERSVEQRVSSILKNGMNDHEKVKAIHDYIVQQVRYDETLNQDVNAPYFALTEGKTLCNGYAMLMYEMLNEAAIPVRLISGYADGIAHAWNLVQLDGEWYHLDATWDDPVPDQEGRVVYNYYMLSDEEINDDHTWQEGGLNGLEKPYPIADADYTEALSLPQYDQLSKSLNLHFTKAEYTAADDETFVELAAGSFGQMAESFAIRFLSDGSGLQETLQALLRQAAGNSGARSWYYSWQEYTRTEESDYIVTIHSIQYAQEVSSLQVEQLPNAALKEGETFPLRISAELTNGQRIDVTEQTAFTVMNEAVAEVENGVLIAKSPGTTTIRAIFHGKETAFQVEVEAVREKIAYPFEGYTPFGQRVNVPADKVWTVEVNNDISGFLSGTHTYVLNQYGEKETQAMELNGTAKISIHPPDGGYNPGETYYLVIAKTLTSSAGKQLKQPVSFQFTIAE